MTGKGKKVAAVAFALAVALSATGVSACGANSPDGAQEATETVVPAQGAQTAANKYSYGESYVQNAVSSAGEGIFYAPTDGRVGSVIPYYEDGVYYLYYLKVTEGAASGIYLVTTSDFVNYEDRGKALDLPLDYGVLTGGGSMIRRGGTYLMFFTERRADGEEVLRLASSQSVTGFVAEQNFVIEPSSYGFENSFGDPYVTFNAQTGKAECLVSARRNGRAVIARFVLDGQTMAVQSTDVLYEDTHGYYALESPSLFSMDGKWYMTYCAQDNSLEGSGDVTLAGRESGMRYLVSENRDGPYREMQDAELEGNVFRSGRFVGGAENVLVGVACDGSATEKYGYADEGCIVAHTLSANADDSLSLAYPRAYMGRFNLAIPDGVGGTDTYSPLSQTEQSQSLVVADGERVPVLKSGADIYRMSMRVSFAQGATSFGLEFGKQGETPVKVTINPSAGKIKVQQGDGEELASRYISAQAGREYQLDVFAQGALCVAYFNGTPFTFRTNGDISEVYAFSAGNSLTLSDVAFSIPSGEWREGAFSLDAGESRTLTVSADTACYLSGYADIYADGQAQISIVSDGTVLDGAKGEGHLSAYSFTDAEQSGKTLSVIISATEQVTVYGAAGTQSTYYQPDRQVLYSRTSSDRGAGAKIADGQEGYVEFSALAVQETPVADARFVLTKNGEEVASASIADGVARLAGAVEAEAGDELAASIDYGGVAVPYTCSLELYGGAQGESNLKIYGADRGYDYDLGVTVASDRTDLGYASDNFGAQGEKGYIYTYGTAIDEMMPTTEFDQSAHTQSAASQDIGITADTISTGDGYMAGFTYIAARDDSFGLELAVDDVTAEGPVLVQFYKNRQRIAEAVIGEGQSWSLPQDFTLDVKAGDSLIFGIKGLSDGAVQAGYTFGIVTDQEMKTIAHSANDFSVESNPNGGWTYGSVIYGWDANQAIKNGNESFTFTAATGKTADAWRADGVEIKAGWLSADSVATIAYTFEKGGRTKFNMSVSGSQEGTRFIIRYAVVAKGSSSAKISTFYGDGANLREWSFSHELDISAGDTIYIMFFKENIPQGSFPQAAYSISFEQ